MSYSEAYRRFVQSLQIDYEKWREGTGYDLSALEQMEGDERFRAMVLVQGRGDWRDVEALHALGRLGVPPAAAQARRLMDEGKPQQRAWAMRLFRDAGQLTDAELESRLLRELRTTTTEGGMTWVFSLAEQLPTEAVRRRLLWGVLHRRDVATHYAALLAYLCGKAESDFDWNLRPLFLRVQAENPLERSEAIAELCRLVEMHPEDAA